MDTKTLLKNILLALREQGKANKASTIGMYIALVRYAFGNENPTQEQICEICNIGRTTLFRNNSFCFKWEQAEQKKRKGKEKVSPRPPL